MKKFILIVALLILFTGCDIKKASETDINNLIDETLNTRVQGANKYFEGYKYYVPRGFDLVNKKGNNHVLTSNGDKYYLYVDIVSYYHKKEITTTFDNELYFSKKILYNDSEGYIKINKTDEDTYFVEMVYNYSKIEVYTTEENLEHVIRNSIKILASIKYNDIILETLIGENALDYKEEAYNFFESKREEGNFMDYIDEYDVYDDSKIKDEDVLESTDE